VTADGEWARGYRGAKVVAFSGSLGRLQWVQVVTPAAGDLT
jgi:hypothetical protein